MNIFVTSECPVECAQGLDDKRVGNMLMESCQMLSLAVKYHNHNTLYSDDLGLDKLTLGLAFLNHPCTIWVRETKANWMWLLNHAQALRDEYQHRFNKTHKSGDRIPFISNFINTLPDKTGNTITPFANCARNKSLDLDFTWYSSTTRAYQAYLNCRWVTDKRKVSWTNRQPPQWRTTHYV